MLPRGLCQKEATNICGPVCVATVVYWLLQERPTRQREHGRTLIAKAKEAVRASRARHGKPWPGDAEERALAAGLFNPKESEKAWLTDAEDLVRVFKTLKRSYGLSASLRLRKLRASKRSCYELLEKRGISTAIALLQRSDGNHWVVLVHDTDGSWNCWDPSLQKWRNLPSAARLSWLLELRQEREPLPYTFAHSA